MSCCLGGSTLSRLYSIFSSFNALELFASLVPKKNPEFMYISDFKMVYLVIYKYIFFNFKTCVLLIIDYFVLYNFCM
jgi:hypothetical protein